VSIASNHKTVATSRGCSIEDEAAARQGDNAAFRPRLSVFIALTLGFLAGVAGASSAGPPAGSSGVPAAGNSAAENTCVMCHTDYPLNPDSQGTIMLSGVPARYTAGQTYRLTVEVRHPEARRWGFQLTAVAGADLHGAGDVNPLPGDLMTQRVTGGVAGRIYIEHGAIGRATGVGKTGGFSWQFNWTAPSSGEGDVTFYGVFNAANGDGSNGGDKIYAPNSGVLAVSKG
jgi:hypothetical protein